MNRKYCIKMIIIKKVIKLVQIIYRNYINENKVFDTFSFDKNSFEPHDIKSEICIWPFIPVSCNILNCKWK